MGRISVKQENLKQKTDDSSSIFDAIAHFHNDLPIDLEEKFHLKFDSNSLESNHQKEDFPTGIGSMKKVIQKERGEVLDSNLGMERCSIFDYDDCQIECADQEEIGNLTKLLYKYQSPQSLLPHELKNSYRIPRHANILLFGPSRVGKSTFINTVNELFGSKMKQRALEGRDGKPGTFSLDRYDVAPHWSLFDSRGIINFSQQEVNELLAIFTGDHPLGAIHRKGDRHSELDEFQNERDYTKYRFDNVRYCSPFGKEEHYQFHLPVLVVSKDISDDEIFRLANFVNAFRRLNARVMAIMTKFDLIKGKQEEEQVVQRILKLHSIGVSQVVPVVNYCRAWIRRGRILRRFTPSEPSEENPDDTLAAKKQVIIACREILSNFETFTFHNNVIPHSQMQTRQLKHKNSLNEFFISWMWMILLFLLLFVALSVAMVYFP